MNKTQEQVTEFHKKFNCPITTGKIQLQDLYLRKQLIKEEAREMIDAINKQDTTMIVDGACDLIYVVLGAMVAFGVDLEPFFDEVHKTNMAKSTEGRRADGKIMKPEDWKPPQIAEMIKNGEGVVK